MILSIKDAENRAVQYATGGGLELKHQLGFGKDGLVYSTNAGTAVKVFGGPDTFERELACYKRLDEMHVHEVIGHAVPKLLMLIFDCL